MAIELKNISDPSAAPIRVSPRVVILGGYSARSAEERDRHIAELRTIGIEPPETVPAFWAISPVLVTTEDRIEVQGAMTSGEAEYVLIGHEGRTYVTVASDQTDREFERTSIPRSKQLCAKVIGREVVPLETLLDGWDETTLSSEVSVDGREWRPYQRSPLAALVPPRELVRSALGDDLLPDGTVLLSGTIPLVDGVTRYDAHFRARLVAPVPAIELALEYRVDILPQLPATTGGSR